MEINDEFHVLMNEEALIRPSLPTPNLFELSPQLKGSWF